jgi:hypothetical protein
VNGVGEDIEGGWLEDDVSHAEVFGGLLVLGADETGSQQDEKSGRMARSWRARSKPDGAEGHQTLFVVHVKDVFVKAGHRRRCGNDGASF